MALVYLTIDQAIEIHRKTVEVSGGGTLEYLDMGRLESILEHIQNDDYYPSFGEKLTTCSSPRASFTVLQMEISALQSLCVPSSCF